MEKRDIKIDVGAVQKTLILPLWARAKETQKQHPLIYDPVAENIVARLDYDFSDIEANKEFAENQQIQWALRAYQFDSSIRAFLASTKYATVINIGAGLDTTFHRVDNDTVNWINIELPDVARLRQQFIPDREREITIAKSIFDFSWIDDIAMQTKGRSILIMAAGVLFYFSTEEVKHLISMLAEAYPHANMIFDVLSSWIWVVLTNWVIMRQSGMDGSVRLQ